MSRRRTPAQRSSLFVCAALAVGVAFSGAAQASAASGSPPPKPQVLWHAYPLDSTKTRARNVHATTPRRAGTKPASAPPGGRTLSTGLLAALGALAAGAVGALVLLVRRRAGARSRGEEERNPDESTGSRGGTVAPVADRKRRAALQASAEEKVALKRTSASSDAEAVAKLKAKLGHPADAKQTHAKRTPSPWKPERSGRS